MSSPPHPHPFLLQRCIGAGSAAEVWLGNHPGTGLPVAVKVLHGAGEAAARELRQEARAVARLDNPNVIRVYDLGVLPDHRPWLAMEYASAGSLRGRKASSFRQLAGWLLAMLDGLAHAHARDVLHLDLSPANVVLGGPSDRRPGPKLVDFGLARAPDERGTTAGTAVCMAPEQFGDAQDVGPAADLYALGCIAWMLTTGGPPFLADTVPSLVYRKVMGERQPFEPAIAVPENFRLWLDRLLEPDPAARFRSAADAAWALLALPGPLPEGAPPHPDDWRPIGFSARPPRLADVGLGLVGMRRTPLVGREDVQDRLWRALGRVRSSGKPAAVVLEGPEGSGRAVLSRWLTERATELGVGWSLDPRAAPELSAASVEEGGPAAALRQRALQLGGDRPLVLRLRDPTVHDATIQLLRDGDLPILAVVSGPVQDGVLPPGLPVERLLLSPLPASWHLTVVENLLGLRPTLARRVIDVAGEKPLVAEQLVRSWAERSWLVPGPDGYDLVDGVEPTFPGLDRLLAERVGDPDRLPRPLLHLLGLAALLPEPLPSERWAEAARRAGLPSPDGAADLGAERGLLFLGPRGWSFRHAALREAVREAAERDAGARLHRAVADLLLATGGPGTQAGEHLLQAGDAAAALPLLRAATLRRIDHSDHSSAARSLQLWRRALVALEGDPHALPWGDWWVQQAFVARAEARFDLAFAAATEAAAIAAEHGDAALACAARLERGRCLLNVGRHDEAATELLASRADAQACGALGTAAAASRMAALARQYQGRHDGAATLAEESLQLYRSLGQPLRAAWAAVTWSQVEKQRGDLAEVERLLRLAQELLPPGQGEAVQAEVENGLGELLRLRGDLDQAQAHYEAALRWGRAAGSTDRAVVEANLGFLLLRRRAWAEARARLLPAREDFERQRRKALVVTLDVALLTAAGGLADWPEWDLRQALVDAGLGDFTYFEIAIHAELPEDQRPVSA